MHIGRRADQHGMNVLVGEDFFNACSARARHRDNVLGSSINRVKHSGKFDAFDAGNRHCMRFSDTASAQESKIDRHG
jgi:hypothetical protein